MEFLSFGLPANVLLYISFIFKGYFCWIQNSKFIAPSFLSTLKDILFVMASLILKRNKQFLLSLFTCQQCVFFFRQLLLRLSYYSVVSNSIMYYLGMVLLWLIILRLIQLKSFTVHFLLTMKNFQPIFPQTFLCSSPFSRDSNHTYVRSVDIVQFLLRLCSFFSFFLFFSVSFSVYSFYFCVVVLLLSPSSEIFYFKYGIFLD